MTESVSSQQNDMTKQHWKEIVSTRSAYILNGMLNIYIIDERQKENALRIAWENSRKKKEIPEKRVAKKKPKKMKK